MIADRLDDSIQGDGLGRLPRILEYLGDRVGRNMVATGATYLHQGAEPGHGALDLANGTDAVGGDDFHGGLIHPETAMIRESIHQSPSRMATRAFDFNDHSTEESADEPLGETSDLMRMGIRCQHDP